MDRTKGIIALMLLIIAGSAYTAPLSSIFTFQGRLLDDGDPAHATYDINVKLMDSVIDGDQVGSTAVLTNVPTTDGYFKLDLNFGVHVFDGDQRWLEFQLKPSGIDPFPRDSILTPRIPVRPTPYALQTRGLFVDISKHVGIGTTDPEAFLSVVRPSNYTSNVMELITITTSPFYNISTLAFKGTSINATGIFGGTSINLNNSSDGNVMMAGGGGKVGIGVPTPDEKLHVNGRIYSQSGGFKFPDGSVQTTASGGSYWKSLGDSIVNTNASNVGIGPVGVPTSKLTVAGSILVKGTGSRITTPVLEIIGGSDLSEQFEIRSAKDLKPTAGMVVSIDPQNAGDLRVSTKAYDRTVAGIISGANGIKPGMLMGQSGTIADGSNPVALTGRVYCCVDASYGSIVPGDLLTTSDTPGHAMKVTEHVKAQGAILGKAMTSLEEGKGKVLVLVTLQ